MLVMFVIPVMLVMCVIPVMCVMCVVLCVCLSPASVYLLRLSVSCVCLVSFYLPPHPFQRVKFNFFKSLSGSTCLTGFNWFEVFGVFGVFEVFKGIRRVQRFYSYNPLSKTHNSFSCPYRRNKTI